MSSRERPLKMCRYACVWRTYAVISQTRDILMLMHTAQATGTVLVSWRESKREGENTLKYNICSKQGVQLVRHPSHLPRTLVVALLHSLTHSLCLYIFIFQFGYRNVGVILSRIKHLVFVQSSPSRHPDSCTFLWCSAFQLCKFAIR